MDEEQTFTIGGARRSSSRRAFEARLNSVHPEVITKYFVEVADRRFPVKQAVAEGLGLLRADFQTQEALRVLRRLGYKPREEGHDR